MKATWRRRMWCVLVPAALVVSLFQGVQSASAAAFLWISAPNWSYSAAAAASPIGSVYFWGLSSGSGTYSFAYAYSHDPGVGSADAFAEASANGLGGVGAVDAVGIADPFAGVGIDTSLIDPSAPSGYPETEPGSDPLSSAYTVTDNGITFTGSGEEMNGSDSIEAFLYNGGTDESSLDTDLGVGSDTMTGNTSSGDVTDMSTLATDFSLIPLDPLISDPGSLSGLTFTENDSSVNPADVILVGEGDAESVPEPGPACLLAVGIVGFLALRRRAAV